MNQAEIPTVRVFDQPIDPAIIANDVQYYPSATPEEAVQQATMSRIILELLRNRAVNLGLFESDKVVTAADEDMLIDKLIEKDVDLPRANSEECERYYQQNLTKFQSSPLIEAKHILIMADPGDFDKREEGKEIAQKLLDTIKSNQSEFGNLVKQFSACPSKEVGGSLGQLSKGQTVAEFEKVLMQVPLGLVDFVIETRFGFHIAIVENRVESRQLPYDMVKERIEEYLEDKVYRKAVSQWKSVV